MGVRPLFFVDKIRDKIYNIIIKIKQKREQKHDHNRADERGNKGLYNRP